MTSALDLNPQNQPRRRSQQKRSAASIQKRPPLRERSSSEANELPSSSPKRHTRQSGSYDGHAKPYNSSGRTPAFAPERTHERTTTFETTAKVMVTNTVDYGVMHHEPSVRVPNLTKAKGRQTKPNRINTKDGASTMSSPKRGANPTANIPYGSDTPTSTWFSPTTATPPLSPPKSNISAVFPFPAVPSQGPPPIPTRRRSLYTNTEAVSPDAQTVPVVLSSSPPPRQPEGPRPPHSASTTDPSATAKQVNRRSSGARYTAFPPPLKSPKRQSLVGPRDPHRSSVTSIGPGHTPIDFSASNAPWPMNPGSTGQPRPISAVSSSAQEPPKGTPSAHLSIQRHPLRQSPTTLAWAGPYTQGTGEPPSEPSTAHQSRQVWSTHLSTIPSESERTSRSMTEVSSTAGPYAIGGAYTLQSHASSGVLPTTPYGPRAPLMPAPLFSPPKTRDSDEGRDALAALRSPTLRPNRPPNANRLSAESNMSGRSSYLGGALPTWVQLYYSRGERASMIDYLGRESPNRGTPSPRRGPPSPPRVAPSPESSSGPSESPESDTIPIVLTRPRNRPYEDPNVPHQAGYGVGAALTADTPIRSAAMAASAPYHDESAFLYPRSTPRPAMQIRSPSASPYLQHDQRAAARMSAWQVPSLDEPVHNRFFSRCNRQIILFCLGFLIPPLWMVAAVLPLPYRPEIRNVGTPSELKLEQEMYNKLGPVDERRYAKARWWRTLNSIMSAVGLVITGIMVSTRILSFSPRLCKKRSEMKTFSTSSSSSS